jgi:CheY-like chemotaxis protein
MGKKILIVDDEPDVVTYLTTVLKHGGFTPISATTAQSGLEKVDAEHPDLICLDIMMPRASGITLYTRLKEDHRFRSIPVIVISGVVQAGEFDFREFVPDLSVPPPEEYVEKPICIDHFLETVSRLIPKARSNGRHKRGSHATN